jgi:hypothetical protein
MCAAPPGLLHPGKWLHTLKLTPPPLNSAKVGATHVSNTPQPFKHASPGPPLQHQVGQGPWLLGGGGGSQGSTRG